MQPSNAPTTQPGVPLHSLFRNGTVAYSAERALLQPLEDKPGKSGQLLQCGVKFQYARPRMRIVQTWPAATEGYDGPLPLAADRVDCWFVSLATFPADAEGSAVAILSEDEAKRATHFHFERQRQCYIRSHAALRLLLARYLMTAPDSIAIVADAFGRPMLAAPAGDLEFNLSHSGGAALVGVSLRSPLGVDIELVRDVPDFLAIAERHFTPSEVEDLLRLAPERRCGGFYVTWTRKEAFVKALGLGLSFPLDTFCTGRQDRPPRLTQMGGAVSSDWTLADLAPARAYKAAVAVRRPNVTFHCREVRWPWLLKGRGKSKSSGT